MKVLSLFDGISCGMVAFERVGIPVERYVAYEIDKYAIKISKKNYPQIEHCGDVTKADFTQHKDFELLIGGSPCQDLSIAGKKAGLGGKRSALFWEFVRALKEAKPRYFLFENNYRMPKDAEKTITKALGVEPILINSSSFSAQSRNRLYWTNIPVDCTKIPVSKLVMRDILESQVDEKYCMQYPLLIKDKIANEGLVQIGTIPKTELNDNERQRRVYSTDGLSPTILARSDAPKILCIGQLDMKASQQIKRVYSIDGLSPTLDTAQGGHRQVKILESAKVRKLTPLECERLQTLPDDYTKGVSNTQRYKCIGNGWTVDVIAHIFKGLK
jgi:DNA (cytosine-5)-methyltransferase 3A